MLHVLLVSSRGHSELVSLKFCALVLFLRKTGEAVSRKMRVSQRCLVLCQITLTLTCGAVVFGQCVTGSVALPFALGRRDSPTVLLVDAQHATPPP